MSVSGVKCLFRGARAMGGTALKEEGCGSLEAVFQINTLFNN